ncbi:MAG: IPT/TIG domain-containing protein [Acidobacteriota bacterium]
MRNLRPLAALGVTVGLVAAGAEGAGRTHAVRVPLPSTITLRVDPPSGPIAGGTILNLRGPSIGDAQRVTIGDAGVFPTRVDADTLRVVTPPHANGFAPIAVTVAGEIRFAEFLYLPPALDSLPNGFITTVAGIGKYVAEGRKATTAFVEAASVAADAAGNIYIAEPNLGVVRRIGADGVITRIAGIGADFAGDDIGEGGAARVATLVFPQGVAVGPDGLVVIADTFNHRIRRIEPNSTIRTIAGSGPNGTCCVFNNFAGDGGPATLARLNSPNQMVWDSTGNMFILDAVNYRIRRVAPDGTITTVAGNGVRGFSGDGGPAIAASFNTGPNGDNGALAIDGDDNLYLADVENRRVRRIAHATDIITTVAEGGSRGIAATRDGTVYFADGSRIRRVDRNGVVTTVVGAETAGFSPDGATGAAIRLSSVDRMALDRDGNLVFVEFGTSRVRRFDFRSGAISTIAGIGPAPFGENGPGVAAYLQNGSQLAMTADDKVVLGGGNIQTLDRAGNLRTIGGGGIVPNGPAPSPRPALSAPLSAQGLAVEASGAVLATSFRELGRIQPDGTYVHLCCDDYGFSGDGGPVANATIDNTFDLALDAGGNLFIADTYNHRVRRVDATTGIITTVAGTAPPHPPNVIQPNPSDGDGGLAVSAHFVLPTNIAVDGAGDLHVADAGRIRKVVPNGTIFTVLGDCAGPMARLPSGNLLIYCSRIMVLEPSGNATQIATVVGGPIGGDGGPASLAAVGFVSGVAVNRAGDVFLFDTGNRRVRAIRGIAAGR